MSDQPLRISDEQARELWRRAAELQAAAEPGHQRALVADTSGLSLEQVAQAAEGAGIDPDYVRVALAEKQLPDADALDRDLWTARWLRKILREPDAIEQSRVIAAAPPAVFAALRAVAARPAFDLILESTIGSDPVRDAVLVYRLGSDASNFQNHLDFADARVLLFTIRPEAEQTRIRVRVPLYRRGVNLALTGGASTLVGAGGMSLGASASAALPAAISATAALAMLPVALGGIAGAALGVGLYRGLYRWMYRDGAGAIGKLLQAIAMETETPHLASQAGGAVS
jgi:hypothetical protein